MRLFLVTCLITVTLAAFGCASQSTDDVAITTKVKGKLAANSDTSAIKIGVETVNGVVTLSGTVPTETEKAKAEEVTGNTDGVARVVNNIRVDPNSIGATNAGEKAGEAVERAKEKTSEAARVAGDAISDAAILARIKAQLVAGGVTGTDVDVRNGDVVIKGQVKSAAEKEKAEVIARTTDGVKSVKSLLTIRKP
ncbi:MAG TPA: BON domain-containing protein [Blastocatellia bacterium]|nr:BON domain-containing protein [Blastocatellia bacterium]